MVPHVNKLWCAYSTDFIPSIMSWRSFIILSIDCCTVPPLQIGSPCISISKSGFRFEYWYQCRKEARQTDDILQSFGLIPNCRKLHTPRESDLRNWMKLWWFLLTLNPMQVPGSPAKSPTWKFQPLYFCNVPQKQEYGNKSYECYECDMRSRPQSNVQKLFKNQHNSSQKYSPLSPRRFWNDFNSQ
jgi:hypothetical protein